MTVFTQSLPVAHAVSECGEVRPRLDVVGMQREISAIATLAGVVVSGENLRAPASGRAGLVASFRVTETPVKRDVAFLRTEFQRSHLLRVLGFPYLSPRLPKLLAAAFTRKQALDRGAVISLRDAITLSRAVLRCFGSGRIPRKDLPARLTSDFYLRLGRICGHRLSPANLRAEATSAAFDIPCVGQKATSAVFTGSFDRRAGADVRVEPLLNLDSLAFFPARLRAGFLRIAVLEAIDGAATNEALRGRLSGHLGLLHRVWGVTPPAVSAARGLLTCLNFTIHKPKSLSPDEIARLVRLDALHLGRDLQREMDGIQCQ